MNKAIKDSSYLIEAIKTGTISKDIQELDINWNNLAVNNNARIFAQFVNDGYICQDTSQVTTKGVLFFSRICIDFNKQAIGAILDSKYQVLKTLHSGKNSASFLSEHNVLGTKLVIKLLRPGASQNVRESLRVVASKGKVSNLVQPMDFFNTKVTDIYGKEVEVECIVFPYIEGITLGQFLKKEQQPLNAHTIATFIKQVSFALSHLESLGAYHGDLHEENIIVNSGDSGNLTFSIIDISFGITGSIESSVCKDNDMAFFRQHIWNLLSAQQHFLAKMSIRKYLGSNIFHIISQVMSPEVKAFSEIKGLFERNMAHEVYMQKKQKFLDQKFTPPGLFKLQRYEEIIDPEVALKLFSPFPELMDNISQFGNIVISGNRGSGKSTYLAALGFFPKVEEPAIDFRKIFGIYFPCRQGEFRLMSPDIVDYELIGSRRVKHVMIIKIIRRTLESIADGIESKKIKKPRDYENLRKFLSNFLSDGEIISLDTDIVSEIRNIVSIMVRIEMKELDNLFDAQKTPLSKQLYSEVELVEFFKTLRETFSEISNTKFHLLFDDAGYPNIPNQTQFILNDLIVSSNPIFCVKLSIERYTYTFNTTMCKQLESGHDYYEYDISRIFFSGGKTFGLPPAKLQEYNFNIVQKRLKYFEYKSSNILDYLGDKDEKYDAFVSSLATGRRNAYYNGWPMVWQLADRTPRNLLELISEIFSVGNVDKTTTPRVIESRDQDRAIRAVSEKRLKSLSQISGQAKVGSNTLSLGKRIFEITSAIGSAYKIYLKSEAGKRRKDQYLALERNDSNSLSQDAENLLKEMIRYGVLDESRLDVARDDQVKKPIYILNKIYCPTFGIGYRRDQHLRLSKDKFEEVFLNPKNFVTAGTKRLKQQDPTEEQSRIDDMFGDYESDN